jgi:L-alanine-DL-glutamate epimerase-like enolase superfamily enzyme
VSLFELIAELPVEVDGYRLEELRAPMATGRDRVCTLIRIGGGGHEGVGEDVVYDSDEQLAFQRAGAVHDLAGRWTLADVCDRVESLDLFPEPPSVEVSRRYRVWAFESALLDLALRQAGRSLAAALGRQARPMRYVCSLRLGEPPTLEPVRRRLALDPGLRFKLDATSSWTEGLIDELVATRAVDSVDFKGFYRGTVVDQAADPDLYRRVAESFPDAWLEDPDLSSPPAEAALGDAKDRITWDAPIHTVADIEALKSQTGFTPRMVNIKPSRIGPIRELLATYEYCAGHGIGAYGGGQTELGPGRGQAQYLAALFHPDGPNDLAPSAYNDPDPPPGIPSSPLGPPIEEPGFRWDA